MSHLPSSFLCSLYPSTGPHNPGVSTVACPLSPGSRQQSLHGTNCGPYLLHDSKGSHSLVLVSLTCLISAVSNPSEEPSHPETWYKPSMQSTFSQATAQRSSAIREAFPGCSGEATLWDISSQGLCGALSRLQSLKNTSRVLTS